MEFPGATDFAASYLKMVNDQGGVNGRKFRYIVYDQDATDSNRALANVRRLNEENKVFAFVGGAHPFSDNIYPYLEEHGAPFFGSDGRDRPAVQAQEHLPGRAVPVDGVPLPRRVPRQRA